jgi:hypothetical protein
VSVEIEIKEQGDLACVQIDGACIGYIASKQEGFALSQELRAIGVLDRKTRGRFIQGLHRTRLTPFAADADTRTKALCRSANLRLKEGSPDTETSALPNKNTHP